MRLRNSPNAMSPDPHTPLEQLEFAGHTLPHAPQLLTSLVRFFSQPLAALPSQLPNPALHELTAQALFEQLETALARLHAAPHAPQFATLFVMLTSQPSAAIPLQLPKPMLQEATAQLPPAQAALALGTLHTVPHAPQLFTLVFVLISQPSDCLFALQSAKPAVQVPLHTPLPQDRAAMLLLEHARPHALQLLASVRMLISQPSFARLLQSAVPPAHRSEHF